MQKVGLVGCGFMGRMHANVYSLLDNAGLVALVDRKPEKRQAYSSEFGVPAYETIYNMFEKHPDLDVVDVCLPTYEHKDAVLMAALAKKNVFCEKPMAMSTDEADEMIDVCHKNGVRLMIGHCIRFWPEYVLLKKLVDEGTLGKLLSVNLTRYGEFPTWSTDNWLADESKSGGGVLDMHIHDTDFAHYLLGSPASVDSWGTVDHRGASQVFTTMMFSAGAVAHLEGGWNLPIHTPFKMAFRAIFERGAAIMDGGPMTVYEDGKQPSVPSFPKMEAAGGGNISDLGGYYHELKYFVDRLESDEAFEVSTPESSRQSLATTLNEIRQIKAKQP
jgi:predicted dehydrogenase